MKISLVLLPLLFFTSICLADPVFLKVEGNVTQVTDYTADKELSHLQVGDPVSYTLIYDEDVDGIYYKNDRSYTIREYDYNQNNYNNVFFTEYVCGDALERGYNNYLYFIGESKKSYSIERTVFNTTKNLLIHATDLVENIVPGSTTVTTTDRSRLAGEPYSASFIKSTGIVTQVSEDNLCSQ